MLVRSVHGFSDSFIYVAPPGRALHGLVLAVTTMGLNSSSKFEKTASVPMAFWCVTVVLKAEN